MQIKDGNLNKASFLEFASVVVDKDPEMMKMANELSEECGKIVDTDRCELAVKACACLKMGGMKRKIDFGF